MWDMEAAHTTVLTWQAATCVHVGRAMSYTVTVMPV